jgi:hypothetical protein
MNKALRKLCCYRGYEAEVCDPTERPLIKNICCWRFYKSRMSANEYIASEDAKMACENAGQ